MKETRKNYLAPVFLMTFYENVDVITASGYDAVNGEMWSEDTGNW